MNGSSIVDQICVKNDVDMKIEVLAKYKIVKKCWNVEYLPSIRQA